MFKKDRIPASADKLLSVTAPEYMFSGIKRITNLYLEEFPVESVILGVSGGIDSALVATLVNEMDLGVKLIGRVMPIETNKPEETQRGVEICELFCKEYKVVNLEPVYHAFITFLLEEDPDLITRIQQGNIKARLRMIYLYHLAQKNKGMVLSTDNLTEFMLGFWTLHGDVGDFGMLQNMWKTEVYELAEYMVKRYYERATKEDDINKAVALKKCIDAVPTDGLGVSNSDLEQLGAGSYKEIDDIITEFFFDPERKEGLKDHPIIERVKNTKFKRYNPFSVDRMDLVIG
jgi:NAD+ synthase